jgi:hypothetical protein
LEFQERLLPRKIQGWQQFLIDYPYDESTVAKKYNGLGGGG